MLKYGDQPETTGMTGNTVWQLETGGSPPPHSG